MIKTADEKGVAIIGPATVSGVVLYTSVSGREITWPMIYYTWGKHTNTDVVTRLYIANDFRVMFIYCSPSTCVNTVQSGLQLR